MRRVTIVAALVVAFVASTCADATFTPNPATPDTSADTPAPDVSGDTTAPAVDNSGDTAAPDVSGVTPDVSGDTSAPDVSGDTSAPDVSGDTSAPDVSGDTSAPDSTLDQSGDTASPDATVDTSGDTASPAATLDTSGDTASPDGSVAEPPAGSNSTRGPGSSGTSAPVAVQCIWVSLTIVGNFAAEAQNATSWAVLLQALRSDLEDVGFTVTSLSANTTENGSLAVVFTETASTASTALSTLNGNSWLQRVSAVHSSVSSEALSVSGVSGREATCPNSRGGSISAASAPVLAAVVALSALLWIA